MRIEWLDCSSCIQEIESYNERLRNRQELLQENVLEPDFAAFPEAYAKELFRVGTMRLKDSVDVVSARNSAR